MVIATLGVMLISLKATGRGIAVVWEGFGEPSALYGLASGASFAVAGVAVRGAVLELSAAGPLAASISALMSVLTIQVAAMGLWLLLREPGSFAAIGRSWRVSSFAGACGALSSMCWFLALGLQKEVEDVLERSVEDLRKGRVAAAYVPAWYATSSSGGGSGGGGGGLFSSSAIPNFGGMMAVLGTVGNSPSSSGSGGGFSGGGSGGGGGGAGGGF